MERYPLSETDKRLLFQRAAIWIFDVKWLPLLLTATFFCMQQYGKKYDITKIQHGSVREIQSENRWYS